MPLLFLLLSGATTTALAQTAPPECSDDEKFINQWYFGYRAGLDFNEATDSIKPVVLTDGRMVARLDRVFQGSGLRLLEGQVRYHGQARFTLRVVAADGFGSRDEAALREQFLQRVPGVQVAVERVEAIPRGANGKFEFVAVDG